MSEFVEIESRLNQAIEILIGIKKSLKKLDGPQLEAQAIENPTEDHLITLAKHEKWPDAVNENLICDPSSVKDKQERGRGIIELMIEEDLNGLKFLDYGCGEGWCVKVANDYSPSLAIGFDVAPYDTWNETQFFTDLNEIEKRGPYDIILLFDVIDHLTSSSPAEVLSRVCNMLEPTKGKIYMRCHPWTSRHATHLYHAHNKAYLHLVFNEEELEKIVPNQKYSEPNIGIKYPIKEYAEFIEKAGLQILNRRDITENVESFFKIPAVADKIVERTKMGGFPEFQMSLQFLDYILKKKDPA